MIEINLLNTNTTLVRNQLQSVNPDVRLKAFSCFMKNLLRTLTDLTKINRPGHNIRMY